MDLKGYVVAQDRRKKNGLAADYQRYINWVGVASWPLVGGVCRIPGRGQDCASSHSVHSERARGMDLTETAGSDGLNLVEELPFSRGFLCPQRPTNRLIVRLWPLVSRSPPIGWTVVTETYGSWFTDGFQGRN